MSNLETAIAVAAAAHMDQKSDNGDPYILHPLRVMMAQETRETQILAVMHDMIEHTKTSLNDIYSFGFDDDIAMMKTISSTSSGPAPILLRDR
jgi:(p)ppGpp synthase/HD superfamily hydrolase